MNIQSSLAIIIIFTYCLLAVKMHSSHRRRLELRRRFVGVHLVAIEDLQRALFGMILRVVELAPAEFLEGRLLALIRSQTTG